MTSNEFEALKAKYAYRYTQVAKSIRDKYRLGITDKGIANDRKKLLIFRWELKILSAYTLYEEDASDYDNYFTVDEMQEVITKLNKLANTHYNADLILET